MLLEQEMPAIARSARIPGGTSFRKVHQLMGPRAVELAREGRRSNRPRRPVRHMHIGRGCRLPAERSSRRARTCRLDPEVKRRLQPLHPRRRVSIDRSAARRRFNIPRSRARLQGRRAIEPSLIVGKPSCGSHPCASPRETPHGPGWNRPEDDDDPHADAAP